MDAVLTKETAYKFLEEVLKIPNPQSNQVKQTKYDFLKNIIINWYNNVPFQNVDQACLTKKEKRVQNVREIISNQMSGRGGVCMTNAIFMSLLLSALEYDVNLVVATIFLPGDHIVVIAKDVVKKGDSYLVEVGCGWPAFLPIPLDELTDDVTTSRVYKDSSFEYLYVREGNFISRYHRSHDYMENESLNHEFKDGWRRRSQMDLHPIDIDYIYSSESSMPSVLVDLTLPNLTRMLLAVKYPNGRAVVLKDLVKFYDNEEGVRIITEMTGKEELMKHFATYFPMLDAERVSEAIDFTQKNKSEWGDEIVEAN